MPKTKEQFEKIKQERMNDILNHSLYLFALHGYDGVTTDAIANAVGCSHGLLYHYFGSKEDLFQEVVNNVAIKIDEEITKDVSFDQKPKFALQDLLNTYLTTLKSEKNNYACAIYLLLNLYIQSRNLPKAKQRLFKFSIFDNIYQLIDKGKECGEFIDNPTRELTVTVTSILKGLSYNRINLGYNKCTIPKSDLIMRMILKN